MTLAIRSILPLLVLLSIHTILQFSIVSAGTEVLRPRGVPLSKKSFYDAGKDFQCLDGSATIPFLLVNDDYCDCNDGSDEPGTNACSNGIFHCSNIGFIGKDIPSSRINDGICDCCDGSDEYNSSVKCANICLELGEQMRVEREKYLDLLKRGNEIRQGYIETAKQKIEETKTELENLKTNLVEAEELKNTRLEVKTRAEELENEALDKHRAKEEELRKTFEEEEQRKREVEEVTHARSVFDQLDLNKDGQITYMEMKTFSQFDRDNDGTVSDDEAKFYLNAANELGVDEFVESSWPLIKPVFESVQHANQEDINAPDTPDDASDDPAEELNHDEDLEEIEPPVAPKAEDSSPPTLEYDELTSQLVEEAKKARTDFTEAEGKFLDLQTKVRELEVLLETDYGPSGEFMALKGQCFELHENEYIYKLCPFESASQRSKNGGSETSLGRWGKWIASESNRYERFLMEGGVQCWNGPARSVMVSVSCGTDNELTRATEPNRCEYAFDFKTPAACVINSMPESDSHHDHTEL